jgi:Protein of unknown function (DUF1579)
MPKKHDILRVRSVVAGLERTAGEAATPGQAQRTLDVFIGKWITTGHTVAAPGIPSTPITASDRYEWAPGGFFVVHSAFGRIGDHPVGGIEIMYYDAELGFYHCHFYDSHGNITDSQLTEDNGFWTWARVNTRCHATFTDDGNTQIAHHEHSEDGVTWRRSMDVTLHKVAA